ncbi:MAG: NAD-dependent epimerase/dehydratase family protein [Pirellulales bacterium]
MSILVTGNAGFIGSHLVEHLLAQGESRIVGLDSFNDYYDPALKRANVAPVAADDRVTLVEGDFCDADLVERVFRQHAPRVVVHLGAYAGVRYSVEHPLLYERNNVAGTLVLLEAARRHGVDRFLLISSSTVYGEGAVAPFSESAPLGVPLSPYGATKQAAETLGFTYHLLHRVPVVCLRPFSVYGPRLRPDLALTIFCAAIAARKPLPLFGDGSVLRDFTHVRDLCAGLAAAIIAPDAVGQAINLGHDQPIAIRDVIAELERALGESALIERLPPKPGDMPLTHADLTKARQLLGYEPKIAFADGVREFVEWFRATQREMGR